MCFFLLGQFKLLTAYMRHETEGISEVLNFNFTPYVVSILCFTLKGSLAFNKVYIVDNLKMYQYCDLRKTN